MWSRRQAMTFHMQNSVSNDTSPALLALKRFVRSTLKQLGIGLAALMVVLNVGAAHSVSASSVSANLASHQGFYQGFHQGSGQNAQQLAPAQALTSASTAHQLEQSSEYINEYANERRIGRGTTYHHLTSARLSIPAESRKSVVSVAEAK
jgi:hypothetical protein